MHELFPCGTLRTTRRTGIFGTSYRLYSTATTGMTDTTGNAQCRDSPHRGDCVYFSDALLGGVARCRSTAGFFQVSLLVCCSWRFPPLGHRYAFRARTLLKTSSSLLP